jgi:hypothetical protein
MNIKRHTLPLLELSLLALLACFDLSAQTQPGAQRPTLDEAKPALNEVAQKTIQALYAGLHPDVTLAAMEVQDMGGASWKYPPGTTNEVLYWPARIHCTFTFTDEKGNSVRQKQGLLCRVIREEGGKCRAEFLDQFDARTLVELAAKLKQTEDTKKAIAIATCRNNLRQLDGAKQQWALENGKSNSDTPTIADIKVYLGRDGKLVTCPEGGTYTLGPISTAPTCSIKEHNL